MFSGKSHHLFHRLRRARIAKQSVIVYKPAVDNRAGGQHTSSHDGEKFECHPMPTDDPERILYSCPSTAQVVAIDEVQFFAPSIVRVCQELVRHGSRVIVAGLDQDYRGEPFGSMPTLLALADRVDKLTAVCTECGRPATKTQRLTVSKDQVEIGASDKYAARCREHHTF